MGMNQSRGNESTEHSNTTTYLGSQSIFEPLLSELGRVYGTQRSMSDLILGGKRYGEARRFMGDEYRDLDRDQARSVALAKQRNEATRPMPTFKDSSGNYWVWNPQQKIYQAREVKRSDDGKGGTIEEFTGKIVGAWSPYDKNNPTPPWKDAGSGGSGSGGGPQPHPGQHQRCE